MPKTKKAKRKKRIEKKNVKLPINIMSFAFFLFAAMCFLTGVYILSYRTVPWAINGILMMFFIAGAMIVHYSDNK